VKHTKNKGKGERKMINAKTKEEMVKREIEAREKITLFKRIDLKPFQYKTFVLLKKKNMYAMGIILDGKKLPIQNDHIFFKKSDALHEIEVYARLHVRGGFWEVA
jgi:hypothetical protein